MQGLKIISVLCLSSLLVGCLSKTSYAPVVNAWRQPAARRSTYTVHKGDTVYSIAWAFGLDYRALATVNHLRPPYEIYPGQKLRMTVPMKKSSTVVAKRKPMTVKPSNQAMQYQRGQVLKVYCDEKKAQACRALKQRVKQVLLNRPAPHWIRPARGSVVSGFSSNLAGNRGINIAGRVGEPIHAAAAGRVVYSGDGIRGYGNLLIIKHNDSYLSAYAFNKKNLVALGQRVKAGQTIAEMGRNNAGRAMLHFEIRHNGNPVNPQHYIRG